jgi:hypothetical protein
MNFILRDGLTPAPTHPSLTSKQERITTTNATNRIILECFCYSKMFSAFFAKRPTEIPKFLKEARLRGRNDKLKI